jgi:hypothetical protein
VELIKENEHKLSLLVFVWGEIPRDESMVNIFSKFNIKYSSNENNSQLSE